MNHPIYQNPARLEKFKNIIIKYEINYDFAFRLRAIEGFSIVMILDDSSSMYTPIIDRERTNLSPFNRLPTRWDEMRHVASIIVDLASTLDPDGVDIYFLNRPPLLHINDSSQLNETFSRLPNGPTPLTRALHEVLNAKRAQILDRKLLILIATDGIPTDDRGESDLKRLETVLRTERLPSIDRIYVTFIACTNDLQSVGFLNQFDKRIPYVDVMDDYQSERAEILAVQGKHFPFSYGDYVVKVLMGSIDPWFDQLDEKKVKLTNMDTQQSSHQFHSARDKNCLIS